MPFFPVYLSLKSGKKGFLHNFPFLSVLTSEKRDFRFPHICPCKQKKGKFVFPVFVRETVFPSICPCIIKQDSLFSRYLSLNLKGRTYYFSE